MRGQDVGGPSNLTLDGNVLLCKETLPPPAPLWPLTAAPTSPLLIPSYPVLSSPLFCSVQSSRLLLLTPYCSILDATPLGMYGMGGLERERGREGGRSEALSRLKQDDPPSLCLSALPPPSSPPPSGPVALAEPPHSGPGGAESGGEGKSCLSVWNFIIFNYLAHDCLPPSLFLILLYLVTQTLGRRPFIARLLSLSPSPPVCIVIHVRLNSLFLVFFFPLFLPLPALLFPSLVLSPGQFSSTCFEGDMQEHTFTLPQQQCKHTKWKQFNLYCMCSSLPSMQHTFLFMCPQFPRMIVEWHVSRCFT